MSQTPAGWYPDPSGRHERRYWDGSTWTEHVSSGGLQGNDSLNAPPAQNPADWYPDPLGRHEHRYWDGSTWTEHVSSRGLRGTDPPVQPEPETAPVGPDAIPPAPVAARVIPPTVAPSQPTAIPQPNKKVQNQIQKLGLTKASGAPDRGIFDESVLVINQKGKLVELRAEYAIFDQQGIQLAAVRGKRLSTRVEVVDMHSRSLLDMRREASLISSKISVSGVAGARLGRIVPSLNWNQVDRSFKLEGASNESVGAVFKEDHRLRDFNVQDPSGRIVARITKTRAGLAKELFTKGDNYVVEILGEPSDVLRSLSVAVALVIDRFYHQ